MLFCEKENNGKYFCLKDEKCKGNVCRGCIKHECEIHGKKEILNPPESYIKGMPFERSLEESHKPINVEDKADLRHMKKWCTKVPNMYGPFIHITINNVELKAALTHGGP